MGYVAAEDVDPDLVVAERPLTAAEFAKLMAAESGFAMVGAACA